MRDLRRCSAFLHGVLERKPGLARRLGTPTWPSAKTMVVGRDTERGREPRGQIAAAARYAALRAAGVSDPVTRLPPERRPVG